jgi:hypothetical protein
VLQFILFLETLFVKIVQLTCSIDESFKRLLMVTPDATSKLLRWELSNTPRPWNFMERHELSTSYQFPSLSMLCSSYPKPKSRNIRPRTLEFYVGDSGDAQVDAAVLVDNIQIMVPVSEPMEAGGAGGGGCFIGTAAEGPVGEIRFKLFYQQDAKVGSAMAPPGY